MKHVMNLHSVPFEMIRSGRKTIELRLYDEKRRLISVGDEIEFVNSSDRRAYISCLVVALHKFESFKDLYEGLPLLKCGYTEKDIMTASADDMNAYYSKEKQKLYGVLGIELKLLH
ncbi:MAG: ASCH domain-containing protein [Clostridia bacterium]|nr:ASCH domain-containing protein [Clostridia bacterium]